MPAPGRPAVVGRLAPTPSGHLHLGNALAFGAAWLSARHQGGRLLLRVEDVDTGRARAAVAEAQRADLVWLGIGWDAEVLAQSARDYAPWLERLAAWTYRCTCTRRMLREADGRCGCRDLDHAEGAWRFAVPPGPLTVRDRRWGPVTLDPSTGPDPVLRRADGVFAYNLAVVADDLADGVTEVVRGADLLTHSAVQTRLWQAFDATPPTWLHCPLVLGADGRKLSKSHASTELRALREAGWSAARVWRTVLPWLGIEAEGLPEAIARFDPAAGPRGPITWTDDGGGR